MPIKPATSQSCNVQGCRVCGAPNVNVGYWVYQPKNGNKFVRVIRHHYDFVPAMKYNTLEEALAPVTYGGYIWTPGPPNCGYCTNVDQNYFCKKWCPCFERV